MSRLLFRGLVPALVLLAGATAAQGDEAEDKAVAAAEKLGGKVYRTPDPKKKGVPREKVATGKAATAPLDDAPAAEAPAPAASEPAKAEGGETPA